MTFSHVLTFAKCGAILVQCCRNAATDTVQNIQRNMHNKLLYSIKQLPLQVFCMCFVKGDL